MRCKERLGEFQHHLNNAWRNVKVVNWRKQNMLVTFSYPQLPGWFSHAYLLRIIFVLTTDSIFSLCRTKKWVIWMKFFKHPTLFWGKMSFHLLISTHGSHPFSLFHSFPWPFAPSLTKRVWFWWMYTFGMGRSFKNGTQLLSVVGRGFHGPGMISGLECSVKKYVKILPGTHASVIIMLCQHTQILPLFRGLPRHHPINSFN